MRLDVLVSRVVPPHGGDDIPMRLSFTAFYEGSLYVTVDAELILTDVSIRRTGVHVSKGPHERLGADRIAARIAAMFAETGRKSAEGTLTLMDWSSNWASVILREHHERLSTFADFDLIGA